MESEQYDVSEKMQRLFHEKQKQRAAAKEYFRNIIYNPHRPINEGLVYDPAVQRFGAMSSYHVEHFRPKPKTMAKAIIFYIAPMVFVFFHLRYTKRKQEELLRSGVVKYEDRMFKFSY